MFNIVYLLLFLLFFAFSLISFWNSDRVAQRWTQPLRSSLCWIALNGICFVFYSFWLAVRLLLKQFEENIKEENLSLGRHIDRIIPIFVRLEICFNEFSIVLIWCPYFFFSSSIIIYYSFKNRTPQCLYLHESYYMHMQYAYRWCKYIFSFEWTVRFTFLLIYIHYVVSFPVANMSRKEGGIGKFKLCFTPVYLFCFWVRVSNRRALKNFKSVCKSHHQYN